MCLIEGDLGDNKNIIENITANSDCCVDRGNGCDIAKDKREEAVATSLFLISLPIIQSIDNIHPQSHAFHYPNNNLQPYTFA